MAINQGLRQGPMTSADTPPPQHTLILSGRLTHAHRRLQTWYTAASSLHLVVYVLIPQRQLSQNVYREHMKGGLLFHSVHLIIIKQFILCCLKQTWHLEGGEKPLHSCAAETPAASWQDHMHSSAVASRAGLCKWEMTVLLCEEYQWSNYCSMSGYWPSAAAPSQRASFLSRPLRGEMSGVLWRAELIMAARIQAGLRRAPGSWAADC